MVKNSSEKHIHLVPSFHYDIEYLLPEGPYLEVSLRNLVEAHRLMKKYPNYTFRVEQTYLAERLFAEYPSLLEDFRRFAKEGRFEIAAGMYSMADINMASGESIIRQLVTGKQWSQQTLGLTPRVLDMGDCTGHPASMPQIAKTCGYDYFVFERAVDDMSRKCEINWRGIDGTTIATYWLAGSGYSGWGYINGAEDELPKLKKLVEQMEQQCISSDMLIAQGGDYQYPFERGLAMVEQWNQTHDTKIEYSTYSCALDAVDFSRAPLETCEWNTDRQGGYSSRIRIKQNNRMCESLLLTAEAITALAQKAYGLAPNVDGLTRAWKLAFLNQFHDTFWGTICDHTYEDAIHRATRVKIICQDIIEDRLRLLTGNDDSGTRRIGIFNPLPWVRQITARVEAKELTDVVTVTDLQGSKVVRADKVGQDILWTALLPACGAVVYEIEEKPADAVVVTRSALSGKTGPFKVEFIKTDSGQELKIETPLYDVQVASGGYISSLRTRADGVEHVDSKRGGFGVLCMQTDRGDLWQYYEGPMHDGGPHGMESDLIDDPYPFEMKYPSRNGRRLIGDVYDHRMPQQAEFDIERIGKEELVIVIKLVISRKFPHFRDYQCEGMRIECTQRITFRSDSPQVDFHLETDHIKGKWYRLRVAFMTNIKDGVICHEIPCGRFERPEGEFAAQNYIAYFDGGKGLALLNNGLPGNNVTDGVMMLSLMRSVSINSRVESSQAFELGQKHQFDYAIIPFTGQDAMEELCLARIGQEFVCAPYVYDTHSSIQHNALRIPSEPTSPEMIGQSLLNIGDGSVTISAIYLNGDDLVVRLYESKGCAASACLTLNFSAEAVMETDAMQENSRLLALSGKKIKLRFKPFEIKTVLIS